MKEWLCEVIKEKEKGMEETAYCWRIFVWLIQSIWTTGKIPEQMRCMIIFHIPMGNDQFQEIGLLEPFWKLMECIMYGRLEVIKLHDCLHGFWADRGTGTTTVEVKLAQKLAFLEQVPLFGTFLNLWKAYGALTVIN